MFQTDYKLLLTTNTQKILALYLFFELFGARLISAKKNAYFTRLICATTVGAKKDPQGT